MPIIAHADLIELAKKCSPSVAPTTMVALVKTESRANPWAIGLNGAMLRYQPKSESQAVAWVSYLDKHGYNFDVGLGQINIRNIKKRKIAPQELIINKCLNLQISGEIITQNYLLAKKKTADPQLALRRAFSMYNTGNQSSGFQNGYVSRILLNNKTINQK